ncbi:MAG: hypothetical protein DWQ05_21845 [Calditrichaeota bacterium]|nr:MAG: hypothetical protein DWQ05_21845 [Calditrichota bacterium]
MKLKFCSLIYLLHLLFLFTSSCKDSSTGPPDRPIEWSFLGLDGIHLERLVLSEGKLYACAGKNGLFRLNTPSGNDNEWEFLGLADERLEDHKGVSDVVTLNDTLLVSHWAGTDHFDKAGISRSSDNGMSWTAIDNGFIKNIQYPTSAFLLTLDQNLLNPDLVIAGSFSDCTDVYFSKDFGLSWNAFSNVVPWTQKPFNIAHFHPKNENEIWVGMNVITSTVRPFLYRTVDFGESWQSIIEYPYNPDAPGVYLEDIAFSISESNTVFAALSKVLLKSMDSGVTWTTAIDTLDSGIFWNIIGNPTDGDQYIACTTDSLYQTFDEGKTWETLMAKPENTRMMKDLVVDWNNKMLYVNTYNPSNGVYRLRFE